MRVHGNKIPENVHIESCGTQIGMVEIRLRENVQEAEDAGYIYDEYIFRLPDSADLHGEIQENLEQWMETGRMLEIQAGASLLWQLRQALDMIYQGVSE